MAAVPCTESDTKMTEIDIEPTEIDIETTEIQKNENAVEAGLKLYRENMAEITLPTETVEAFSKRHLSNEKPAIAKFLELSLRDADQKYQNRLLVKITEEYHSLCKSNAKASQEKCDKIFKGLYQENRDKEGSYQDYKSYIEEVVRKFKETPAKGIKEEDALYEFLESKAKERSAAIQADSKMSDREKQSEDAKRPTEMSDQKKKVTKEEDKQSLQITDDMKKSTAENFQQLKKKMEDHLNKRIEDLNREHDNKMKESGRILEMGYKAEADKSTWMSAFAGIGDSVMGAVGATATTGIPVAVDAATGVYDRFKILFTEKEPNIA